VNGLREIRLRCRHYSDPQRQKMERKQREGVVLRSERKGGERRTRRRPE
jgi:hypothetical protein